MPPSCHLAIIRLRGEKTMKRTVFAASIVGLVLVGFGTASGQAPSSDKSEHYSQAQLKQMTLAAHTPEQYKALASSYTKQQSYFLRQAAEEKQEWERRSANIVSVNAKYPRPVDSARYLYEYDAYKASEAGALSLKYAQLGGTTAP